VIARRLKLSLKLPTVRLLVTGGAGFIGSHYVRTRLAADASVHITVMDKLTYSGNKANLASVLDEPRLDFVLGDICDAQLVNELMPGHQVVVHFAAESHVDRSIGSGDRFVLTNLLGTQVLLDAAHQHGVERFIHVSTDEVYGSIEAGSWPETHPLQPNSPYSATKAGSDLLARAYHRTHGLDVVVTRCSNNYGPYQFPEKVIPLFVTNLLDGHKVPLYGDGGNVRDWLHVDDHCLGIQLAAERGRAGETYNIGGGTELTNSELTALLLEACGADWGHVEHVIDRAGHDRRYSVDTTKISEELGYAPRIDFATGLADTVTWYRKNRTWWEPLVETLRSESSRTVAMAGTAHP
jgi:dTDP-glucose 4,6-dehydratase